MQQGLFACSAKTVEELRALDPPSLTSEQKLILPIAYDEEPRAARGSRDHRSRSYRSPPRNNWGEEPKDWERRRRR